VFLAKLRQRRSERGELPRQHRERSQVRTRVMPLQTRIRE
jgi:hypothetical protein